MVKSKQAALGLDFWQDPEHAPTNPTALKRTFGQKGPIRVWLQLEEKRIPYTMEKVNMRCYGDKQRSFLAKVPNGLLPVIELDGQVVTESAVIMQLLEEVGAPG
ncbi:GST N-terminal domain-containing protein, partial [Haematococcus lacustris]